MLLTQLTQRWVDWRQEKNSLTLPSDPEYAEASVISITSIEFKKDIIRSAILARPIGCIPQKHTLRRVIMTYQYQLKNAPARKTTDLTSYKDGITKAVQNVIGKHVSVRMKPTYYEFFSPVKVPLTKLQDIGRLIARYVPELEDKKLQYDYISSGIPTHSNQRFVRRNSKVA